jgi:hypothetical protein
MLVHWDDSSRGRDSPPSESDARRQLDRRVEPELRLAFRVMDVDVRPRFFAREGVEAETTLAKHGRARSASSCRRQRIHHRSGARRQPSGGSKLAKIAAPRMHGATSMAAHNAWIASDTRS